MYQIYHIAPKKCFCQQQLNSTTHSCPFRSHAWWNTQVLGGSCNRNIFLVVFESVLSPHKHVLTLGLPAFCQCRTYLASRETAVFLVMRGVCMSAVVGQFSWLGCSHTQVHMSSRLLFTYVCCDMLQQDRGQREARPSCERMFSFPRSTTLLSWRWSMWRSKPR